MKAGQLLAVLDPGELEQDQAFYTASAKGATSQVEESVAALRFQERQVGDQISQAEANVAATQSDLTAAQAELANAKANLDRSEMMVKQGVISEQDVDSARTTFQVAQSKLGSIEKQIDAQRAAVALARSNAEQVAMRRSQLENNQNQQAAADAAAREGRRAGWPTPSCTRPIDGIVDVVSARIGEVVNPSQPGDHADDQSRRRSLGARQRRGKLHRSRPHRRQAEDSPAVGRGTRRRRERHRGIEAAYATQRDVSRTKRDIKTFEIRLRSDNRDRRLAAGLTAHVLAAGVMKKNAIEVRDIVKKFGDFTAVNGISFAVEEGEIFGLLGPNGAGKSTLIRMLVTLLQPTSGTALVGGFNVSTQSDDVRRAIGVIAQNMTSDLELSVEENLIIYAKLYGVPREKRTRLIHELLPVGGAPAVEGQAGRSISQAACGAAFEEIARGLVHEPRVFFLDEPTTGLDPVSRTAVWEMLQTIKSQRDLTILITTHYMDEADKLLQDRIMIVDHGKLVALDSPLTLKTSIPTNNVLEVSFPASASQTGSARLVRLPHVDSVTRLRQRLPSLPRNGPATTLALMDAAAAANVTVKSLSVQSTTLDDVFVHYTGRALRDELQDAKATDSPFMIRRG